ncbi:MAG: ThuA domain-containing protein [Chloroflexota bacterium]
MANTSQDGPIRVLCWSERTESERVYPEGINGAVAQALQEAGGFETRTAKLEDQGQGLTEDLLGWADVLTWFGHGRHRLVEDGNVARIVRHIKERGMGFIPLHSSHFSKPFKAALDHSGSLGGWREDGRPSVVYVCQPDHPIAKGIDRVFVVPREEMYCEPFGIKPPDELVFISSFAHGEVFRSGACWYAGQGRVFYFQPGHETYPVYFQKEIKTILVNAARWAAGR